MPAPAAPEPRQPDAVLISRAYPPGVAGIERLQQLNRTFGPVLGSARVAVGDWMGGPPGQQFLRREDYDPHATSQQFPVGSPLAGRSRYDWFVAREAADGTFQVVAPVTGLPGDAMEVRLGFLLDEADLTAAAEAEVADPEYEAALQRAAADPATRSRMVRAGLLPGQAPADAARAAVAAKAKAKGAV